MKRSRGRPQNHKDELRIRLPILLIAEIKSKHPEFLRPGTNQFRSSGQLSSWLERLIWKELRGTANVNISEIRSPGISDGSSSQQSEQLQESSSGTRSDIQEQ